MQKENGRLEPAKKSEIADLKGKHMKCSNCGEYAIFNKVEFANMKCGTCGGPLIDLGMSNASKATGN
jgi:ribosomal protein L32